ncbi:nuclease-related domain-containing protein [Alteribacter natronophilus]|uniref:nuclease-related domain-containing protein n=1 Tax=Alteribacter natronophilus TaxID=2583810 RepID=UPI0014874335|nr:nuclease-related domain-containing protein [Alteribacter natronophilus]
MMLKPRNFPLWLDKLEALKRRLSPDHRRFADITQDHYYNKAGWRGEKELDYQLDYLVAAEDYVILQDLRLKGQLGREFQVDTIIIFRSFIVVVEAKNYRGTLYFDQAHNQLTQTYENVEKGLPDPIAQVKLQTRHLHFWLAEHGYPPIPIHYFIAISNPRTIIKSSPGYTEAIDRVIHAQQVNRRLSELQLTFRNSVLSSAELQRIGNDLIAADQPYDRNILEFYKIDRNEILTGVPCRECKFIPMKRVHGSWACKRCGAASMDAHVQALKEFSLIFGERASNRELRWFLQARSPHVVKRLMEKLDADCQGEGKARRFILRF